MRKAKIMKKLKNETTGELRKGRVILSGVLLITLFVGAFYIFAPTVTDIGSEISPWERFLGYETLEARLIKNYQPERYYDENYYGDGLLVDTNTGENFTFPIKYAFEELEPIPDDFWRYKYMFDSGRLVVAQVKAIGPEYYEQPEFIRDNFEEIGLRYWKNPDIGHWTPEGYGCFPRLQHYSAVPGEIFETVTFLQTSWPVETYQGFTLIPSYPSYYNDEDGTIHYINATKSREYFKVTLSPNVLLMTPCYPIFEHGWNRPIILNVEIKENTPSGVYAIGFDLTGAPKSMSDAWAVEYGELYSDKSGFGIGTQEFKLVVTVN